MDKKAAELTMNVIIIAVLALIVLAVLLIMFSGKMKSFSGGLKECASLGGECKGDVTISDDVVKTRTCPSGSSAIPNTNCEPQNVCCISLV